MYEFAALSINSSKNYLYQRIAGRKLTDRYHSHDFYELVWLLHGSAGHLVNGRKSVLSQHDAVLMRPFDRHAFLSQSNDIELISLSIKKEEFERLAGTYHPLLTAQINHGDEPICLQNGELSGNSRLPADAVATDYDGKWILSDFLHLYASRTALEQTYLPQQLETAIQEMSRSDNLRLGIPAFCTLSHYSQSHLSRLIKRYFGMSLKQYVNELRLQSAHKEIVLTQTPFEEIAESVGFLSHSHFHKIFKERFGVTPSSLRKHESVWTV